MNLLFLIVSWCLNFFIFKTVNGVRVFYEETYPILKPETFRSLKIKNILNLNNFSDIKVEKDNQFLEIFKTYISVKLESIKDYNISSTCLGQIENLLTNFYSALNQTENNSIINNYWSLKGFFPYVFEIYF